MADETSPLSDFSVVLHYPKEDRDAEDLWQDMIQSEDWVYRITKTFRVKELIKFGNRGWKCIGFNDIGSFPIYLWKLGFETYDYQMKESMLVISKRKGTEIVLDLWKQKNTIGVYCMIPDF
jgi:hypothetical protein